MGASVSGLACRKALVGTGRTFSVLFGLPRGVRFTCRGAGGIEFRNFENQLSCPYAFQNPIEISCAMMQLFIFTF